MGKELSKIEREGLQRGNNFVEKGRGYSLEHATRPGTIGIVLASSPVALLGWYVDNIPSIDSTEMNAL